MVTQARMSLQEFLALPDTTPYRELVRGEAVTKPMPNATHSRLVPRIIRTLGSQLRGLGVDDVDTELRHPAPEEGRVYLPDVSLTRRTRLPATPQDPVEVPPDTAIEVLSPDDRVSNILDKVDFYLRIGVQLTWIIDPERRAVTIYRPGESPRSVHAPETLTAEPVFKGVALPLGELFDALPSA